MEDGIIIDAKIRKVNNVEVLYAKNIAAAQGQNLQIEKTKFINLLILEHLKSHFIKPQFMCFEINGLKCLKLTILPYPSYSNSSKNIFYC